MYYVKGDETLPDCEWNMDIKYQQKENLEALVNEQINVLELTDILKIDKNLTISLTKWPLDYAAGGLYQADSFGQTVCDPIDDYKSCHITKLHITILKTFIKELLEFYCILTIMAPVL